MIKAVFRKFFKSSSKDKVGAIKNNNNSNDLQAEEEVFSSRNVNPSPSRKAKW
jgi:hypothetical protein